VITWRVIGDAIDLSKLCERNAYDDVELMADWLHAADLLDQAARAVKAVIAKRRTIRLRRLLFQLRRTQEIRSTPSQHIGSQQEPQ
jgi:hypothetical protein